MERNKVVIVSDGYVTQVFLNGEVYGDDVQAVNFIHDSTKGKSIPEILLTVNTMPVRTSDKETFERFMLDVLNKRTPNDRAIRGCLSMIKADEMILK